MLTKNGVLYDVGEVRAVYSDPANEPPRTNSSDKLSGPAARTNNECGVAGKYAMRTPKRGFVKETPAQTCKEKFEVA